MAHFDEALLMCHSAVSPAVRPSASAVNPAGVAVEHHLAATYRTSAMPARPAEVRFL